MQNTMVQDGYCRTGSELAAELYEIAALLDGLGDLRVSPVYLSVHLQAVAHEGTPAERTASVNILADNLGLPPGFAGMTPGGMMLHSSSGVAGRVDVHLYTRVSE